MGDGFDHEAKDCPCRIDVTSRPGGEIEWVHGDCARYPNGHGHALLGEIRDLLKSIDAKLTPTKVELKPAFQPTGRVFSAGQLIPDDVDLVVAGNGMRWKRMFNDMRVALDRWYPRDIDGDAISGNELITLNGHVTEVPAPGGEAST